MADGIEELLPLTLAKAHGKLSDTPKSKSADDLNHNWTETSYDGKPDSQLLEIPNHWHKYHDEVMEVLEGRMKFFVGGKEIIATPESGPILITRGTIHGFTTFKGEAAKFSEKTIPSGDYKGLFFQDLFQAGTPGPLMAFRTFSDHDTWVALPGGIKFIDEWFTWLVGRIAVPFVPAKLKEVKRK